MPLQVIEVDPADTFYSVRDRLLRLGRARAVLVLPPSAAPVNGVHLVLLRRLADRERLDVGLVTTDRALARQARALGLPAFTSVTLAEHYRPGWWRAGRRSERVGFAPGDPHVPAGSPVGTRRVLLFLILTVLLLLSLVAAAVVLTVPRAKVTIPLNPLPVQIITDLRADPSLAEAAGDAVPAQEITHHQAWEVRGPASGDPDADRQRLLALARQGLGVAAPDLLTARLDPGLLLAPASVEIDITDETFTQTEGEVHLTLDAALSGLAVPAAELHRLAFPLLAGALPAGYVPDPATVQLQVEPPAGAPDQLQLTARAAGQFPVDGAALADVLRGQRTDDAARALASALPDGAEVTVEPAWWAWLGRLPLRAGQIVIERK
jgi:hypothetical protein